MEPSDTLEHRQLAPGVRAGSYLVEKILGAGGMGHVFAARHVGLDKPVVLKALHPTLSSRQDAVTRFVREGRAASKIRHPHVVDVTDVGTHEGVPFLVMECLEGEDLHHRLHATGPMSPSEIARIMLPVCDAVAHAHDAGVIHRDLKPSNIFLAAAPNGREVPKVLDFGIARIVDTQLDRVTVTHAASFLGTPFYVAPEQAQSGRDADARSDQFSLGVILYQLATGRTPVEGGTPFEVICAIIQGISTPIQTHLPNVDPRLAAIVERAMAFAPDQRYPDVRALGRDLLQLADPAVRAQSAGVFGADPIATPAPAAPDTSPDAFAPTMVPASVQPALTPAPPPAPAVTPAFTRPAPVKRARALPWLALSLGLVLLLVGGGVAAWWVVSRAPGSPVQAEAPSPAPRDAVHTEPAAEPPAAESELAEPEPPEREPAEPELAEPEPAEPELAESEGVRELEPPEVASPELAPPEPRARPTRVMRRAPTPSGLRATPRTPRSLPRALPAPRPRPTPRPPPRVGANNAPILD